jgi:hypothetical protein
MPHHEQLESVRAAARHILQGRIAEPEPAPIIESAVLRGGRLAGHQFVAGRYKLRWLIGQPHLTMFEDGQPPRTIDWTQTVAKQKAA